MANDLDNDQTRTSIAAGKQTATSKLPAGAARPSSAAPAVQRKGADTGADWTGAAFRPDLHGAPVQMSPKDGITGGKVTHADFKGEPRTADPTQKKNCLIVRELIDSLYGANQLYTGMGATLQENGQLGGREVMITENGTGLKLTPDNHVLVSLGTMTQADYDSLP